MTMTVEMVERIIDRKLSRLQGLVELLDSVEHLDAYAVRGKGIADQQVDADLVGQYGVMSRPPDGGDAVIIKLGGQGASSQCIGFRHREHEVQIEKGEILIRDDQGQFVHVKRDGIHIDGQKVVIAGGGAAAVRVGDPVEFNAAFSQWINTTLVGALATAGIVVAPFIGPEIGTSSAGSAKVEIG